MNTGSAVLDFEIYVLMTMRLRLKMSQKEDQLEAKLSGHGLSRREGESIHRRVRDNLHDELSFFGNLRMLLRESGQNAESIEFSSVLWPEFDFKAAIDEDGRLQSARYWHQKGGIPVINAPTDVTLWSMDVTEFAEHFGPITGGRRWPLFDEYLPAYEEREFEWNEWPYGAGFSWGLFMFTAQSWE